MTIGDLEEAYQQLHSRLLRGELDEEEFKVEVERLRFEDDLGRQWRVGWYTGRWYQYAQGQWLQGEPRDHKAPTKSLGAVGTPTPTDDAHGRRSTDYWLVWMVVGLLLVACVVLVVGWSVGWWGG